VANVVSGGVPGTLVQAGAVHGGVHVYQRTITPVPRQLPPRPAHFTNRTAEIATLDSISQECSTGDEQRTGTPKLASLVGPGGVGKTALAVWWGVHNADRYGDGQLYADLRGFSPGSAAEPEEVLNHFLLSLGVAPEQVPVRLAEQAALFRTLTKQRHLLVVLDNALSAAQIRPLLPASERSTVVVTSRYRLGGLYSEGAVFVDVDPLPQQHAAAFLTSTLGPSRVVGQADHIDELVSLCGRLPIALRVVAARLAIRPKWPIRRLVDELASERDRLGRLTVSDDVSVLATFDLSYQVLDDDQARLYRLASVHPGPYLSLEVAAAAANLSESDTHKGLQALVDASLLEEVDENRYEFHDLLRLHGRAIAREIDREDVEALRRIAMWFLHQATRANMVVIPMRWRVSPVADAYRSSPPAFGSGPEALDWLDHHLTNLVAVIEAAAERGLDEVAWQVCEALWELFLHRKHFRIWIATHEVGVAAAHRCGAVEAEARLRCQLGRAYLDLNDVTAAERECQLAVELARRAGSLRNESVAVNQLGQAAQARGDIDNAIAHFQRSLHLEKELGFTRGVAIRHRRIGEALLQAGRDAQAAVELEQARKLFVDVSDRKDEAKTVIALARITSRQGNHTEAMRQLEGALCVLGESGSAIYHAEVLLAFADVCQDSDDIGAARAHLNEALGVLRDTDSPLVERVRNRLAELDRYKDH
jgi:tetratricopeptide (TPR) repeat protein